jgi:hypothetical protein
MGRLSNLRVVDPVLTNLATGYTNEQFVGSVLMPFVQVEKEGGKIPLFGKEHFKVYSTERALRAKSNRINPEDIGSVDVAMDEHDLEYPIDYREDAESAFPLQARATNTVVEGIRLRHEKMVADLTQATGSYASGNKIALSGTNCFSDYVNSDPEGVVSDAKAAVRAKVVKEPNTMVIGYSAWRVLKRHPQLKGIISNQRNRLLTIADLRDIFEIENVVVGRAVSANDAGVTSDLWADNLVLAYVPQVASGQRSQYEPSFGYTLQKRGSPVIDTRTEDGKIELIRNTDIFRPFLLGADAGYLISNTNA